MSASAVVFGRSCRGCVPNRAKEARKVDECNLLIIFPQEGGICIPPEEVDCFPAHLHH